MHIAAAPSSSSITTLIWFTQCIHFTNAIAAIIDIRQASHITRDRYCRPKGEWEAQPTIPSSRSPRSSFAGAMQARQLKSYHLSPLTPLIFSAERLDTYRHVPAFIDVRYLFCVVGSVKALYAMTHNTVAGFAQQPSLHSLFEPLSPMRLGMPLVILRWQRICRADVR